MSPAARFLNTIAARRGPRQETRITSNPWPPDPSRSHVALQRLRASHLSTLVIGRDAETAPKSSHMMYVRTHEPSSAPARRTSPVR
ncbi:hypothetical protein HETIRDRAFT_452752 [Heterobasidion irregulare TC 32-1]|uniref:Uncharacterized protein n=1 Tax=Heterobasidion irregulare (strain TC 32-1) TaxID=747525 RepID=W4K2Q7_HETIT|nr:uncharacterized protein HETIRDRAFT_452752 [Heterobasidion irregulare TC 32-1]ETW79635.1 hypothetical protein HETIRDRAFT_452752 [Heterobasidion irregulare TC 32-1]